MFSNVTKVYQAVLMLGKNSNLKIFKKMAKKPMEPDKANCTYWWIIYLNQHPANSPTLKEMTGYSKFQNHAEALDPNNVLMAKIEMFYKNGYLDRSIFIKIYKKVGPFPNKYKDTLVLTLYPTYYIIPLDIIDRAPRIITNYLKNFYNAIANNKEIKFLRPLPSKRVSKDDLYDINEHNFKDYNELYAYADKMKAGGQAPGQVNDFIRRYSEKKFPR